VPASEPEAEPRESAGWGEDLFLVALFAIVGALGMLAGAATDSAVEVCIGLVLVVFAAKVLLDVLRARGESLLFLDSSSPTLSSWSRTASLRPNSALGPTPTRPGRAAERSKIASSSR
jgi:hypothetical protein